MKDTKITQTAGRDGLGDFAPNFAHFNDDILFGEQWNDESISTKTKCIVTVPLFYLMTYMHLSVG